MSAQSSWHGKLNCWGACLLVVAISLGCSPAAPSVAESTRDARVPAHVEREIDSLLVVMRDRLLLMHDVAEFKRRAKLPVTDPAREQQVLDQTAEAARRRGLDPAWAVAVVRAQIEAGKLIQERDLNAPSATAGDQAQPPELATTIRPQIDAQGEKLLDALAQLQRWRDDQHWRQRVSERAAQVLAGSGIDDEVRHIAIKPLID